MPVPHLDLNDGRSIPQLGFGVFQVDPATTADVVGEALGAGYRHIDTAASYQNEAGVGAALVASGLPRDDVFITTKLANTDQGRITPQESLANSLTELGVDAVDLYLIHWPCPDKDLILPIWEAFAELQATGLARSIGVSNFRVEDLHRLRDAGLPVPAVNQIELHPYFTQPELRALHEEWGIRTEAWSPLGQGGELLEDPVLSEIAAKHGTTTAAVVIAWHLALGNVVIPKSVTPSRIAANLAAADLALDGDDVAAISALDRGGRIGPDPSVFGS